MLNVFLGCHMKDTVGALLRERWKEKENAACQHPQLSQERSFSGILTGASLCTTCGAIIESQSQEKGKSQ